MQEKDDIAIKAYIRNELGDDWRLENSYTLIPYITVKPTPEAFNLTEDSEEYVTYLDEKDRLSNNKKRAVVAVVSVIAIIWFVISMFAFGRAGYTANSLFSFIESMLLYGFLLCFIVPIVLGIMALFTPDWFRAYTKQFEETKKFAKDPREDYAEYKKQLSMYEYWEKRRSPSIWAMLDDRGLNGSLTQVYRRDGYKVGTEHQFYGEHRELSLEKDGIKTIVYAAKSGEIIDASIVNQLAGVYDAKSGKVIASTLDKIAGMAKFDHAVIATISSVPADIRNLAKQNHVEMLDWQKIVRLV